MTPTCLVIADDLTGGADTGATFASRGLDTLLVSLSGERAALDLSIHGRRDVLVVNSESRGVTPQAAGARVTRLLQDLAVPRVAILYKKIDSTLRGNVGAEIEAILSATHRPLAFFAPAFPEQARAVVGGMVIVNGGPLALADVSRASSAGRDSHVQTILARQTNLPSAVIDLQTVAAGGAVLRAAIEDAQHGGARVLLFDALQRRDLAHIAAAAFEIEEMPLLVGSAGLAGEVAQWLTERKGDGAQRGQDFRCAAAHTLIVCGSKSGIARRQIQHVEQQGLAQRFELQALALQEGGAALAAFEAQLADRLAQALASGSALLTAPAAPIAAPAASSRLRESMARIARRTLAALPRHAAPPALLLTGGATAASVFAALGVQGFEIQGEVLPGIAHGRLLGGPWEDVAAVTKAGGFGAPACFATVIEALAAGVGSRKRNLNR